MITGIAAASAARTHDCQFAKLTDAAEDQSAIARASKVAAKALRKVPIGLFANHFRNSLRTWVVAMTNTPFLYL
jgi:hypothetical protein